MSRLGTHARTCCDNAAINAAVGCDTQHTFEHLMELVSAYRDKVPKAAQIAGAFCAGIIDDSTKSDMPASVSMLPGSEQIVQGRRELLDQSLRMHGKCLTNALYHGVERVLQRQLSESTGVTPVEYHCTNGRPREFAPRTLQTTESMRRRVEPDSPEGREMAGFTPALVGDAVTKMLAPLDTSVAAAAASAPGTVRVSHSVENEHRDAPPEEPHWGGKDDPEPDA